MAIGRNGPRYSSGALGFISHISICEDPPHIKNTMVDLAREPPVLPELSGAPTTGLAIPEQAAPVMPDADATSIVRLSTGLRPYANMA